jgi:hypothetical protein
MDEACDMVALPWVLRKAIAVLNTLEVRAWSHGGARAGFVPGLLPLSSWQSAWRGGALCV